MRVRIPPAPQSTICSSQFLIAPYIYWRQALPSWEEPLLFPSKKSCGLQKAALSSGLLAEMKRGLEPLVYSHLRSWNRDMPPASPVVSHPLPHLANFARERSLSLAHYSYQLNRKRFGGQTR